MPTRKRNSSRHTFHFKKGFPLKSSTSVEPPRQLQLQASMQNNKSCMSVVAAKPRQRAGKDFYKAPTLAWSLTSCKSLHLQLAGCAACLLLFGLHCLTCWKDRKSFLIPSKNRKISKFQSQFAGLNKQRGRSPHLQTRTQIQRH